MATAHRQQTGLQQGGDALLTDDAKRWIAENLLLGASNDEIASRLTQLGCPLALALAEIRIGPKCLPQSSCLKASSGEFG